ncbi:unnamed protein product [Prunus armeniaca]
MHDMIRAMGKDIVRQESEEPWKRSRIWQHKDSFKILTEKKGSKTIEGLVLDMHMSDTNSPTNSKEKVLETNAFARMHKLKLLHLSHVQLDGSYAQFCTGLRWLCWLKFPLDSIPTDFPLGSLIVLEMQYSSLRQVFEGTKCLLLLKILDLSHSHSLTETIDFSFCPNLEKLILVDCVSLICVHGSIGNLERLVYLSMKDCKNLRILPENMFMLKLLEALIISGCINLELPIEMLRSMESLKVLETDGIPIGELWPGRSSCILSSLPCSLVDLSLYRCNISDDAFTREFSNLASLQRLDLVEWEYRYKLEPIGRVDVEIINLLGLCNLESMAPIQMHSSGWKSRKDDCSSVQGLYEWGIFSTFFVGNEVPGQFSHKSTKSSISFTVPSLPNHRIRGLKVFVVYTKYVNDLPEGLPGPIITRVKNKSKGLKWIYGPICFGVPGEGEDMIWLSHWKLGEIVHLEGGDQVVVSVIMQPCFQVKEFGIQLVQVQEENYNMMAISTDSYLCVRSGDLRQYEPGVYLLSSKSRRIRDPIWLQKLLGDPDGDTTDEEEEQQDDLTIAAMASSNDSGGLHGWKLLITASCFFLMLSLITWSSRSHSKKRQSKIRG